MRKTFGEIIAALRQEKGFSQKEQADYLKKYGIEVSNQAISKWEKDMTQPNAQQFLALCELYGVSDVLGTFCGRSSGLLSGLNDEGIRRAKDYINDLRATGLYNIETVKTEKVVDITKRLLPIYRIAASAGTGQFLDGDEYDMVEVGDEVPQNASFGVRLAGDSMEPRFINGQIVWIHQQQELNDGDIGLFLYDGNAYCKKLRFTAEGLQLVSLNRKYVPIAINEDSEFRVFGKVIG